MRQTRKYVGLARCPSCQREFPMRSGVHTYCEPSCRPSFGASHHKRLTEPRTYRCRDCAAEEVAGVSGVLPRRCPPCTHRHQLAQRRRRRQRKEAT